MQYYLRGLLKGLWPAAGTLLIQEAGGIVGDVNGGSDHMKIGSVVAGNPKVF